MKSKGGTRRPERGITICIISIWSKCLAFSSIMIVLYVRTGTDTARNIFTKNVSAFRSDAKVIIF